MRVRKLISVEAQDPLGTVRNILGTIWSHSGLHGLFIALWQDGNPPQSELITSPGRLNHADPFAPVMQKNSAYEAAQTLKNHPHHRLGFVLRPCELRSFVMLIKRMNLKLKDGLLISSDCLATFPPEDFDWRLESSEDREHMTRSAMHFAAQGGLQPSQYRNCCQFCEKPYPENSDLSIELFGIATSENLVINLKSADLFESFGLDQVDCQPVPDEITHRRERILVRLKRWRQQTQAYDSSHLNAEHKTIDGLIQHISECSTCRQALQNCCPLFDLEWISSGTPQATMHLHAWLQTCSGCGMCEADCPKGYPLFRAIIFISKTLPNR